MPSPAVTSQPLPVITAQPSPQATNTAAATPTSGATQVPAPNELEASFREFARTLSGPLSGRDSAFFRDRIEPRGVVCTEDDVRLVDPEVACANVGQPFDGVPLSYWASDRGGHVSVDSILALIERLGALAISGATDQFGTSAPRAYAISFPDQSLPPEAPRLYSVVLTAIHNLPMPGGQTGPGRVALITQWEFVNGQWRLTRVLDAFRGGGDFVEPTQEGRNYLSRWERLTP